jgi:hypothetical protein
MESTTRFMPRTLRHRLKVAARAQVDAQGGYTLTLPGGGLYEIHCGPIRRSCFVASATCSHGFDFELAREIAVGGQCPETVRPGEPFQLQVNVRRLGSGTGGGSHRLSLRPHNLDCQDPKATVDLTGRSSACVTFDLVPRRPAKPFLILVIPDGQLQKRAEWMGIAQKCIEIKRLPVACVGSRGSFPKTTPDAFLPIFPLRKPAASTRSTTCWQPQWLMKL